MVEHSRIVSLERCISKHNGWLQHDLRIPPTAAIAALAMQNPHLTQILPQSTSPLLHYPFPHTTLNSAQLSPAQLSTAHTPLVSLELSGIGSIIGPTSPFSPGWFVPFSIPTFEMPESDATCLRIIYLDVSSPFLSLAVYLTGKMINNTESLLLGGGCVIHFSHGMDKDSEHPFLTEMYVNRHTYGCFTGRFPLCVAGRIGCAFAVFCFV